MRRISIYGKPSYTYDVLKGRVLETINSARIGIHLNEINSVKKFIDVNIDSIPAISVDGEIRTIGKSKLNDFIDEVQTWILSKHDTSQDVKMIAAIDLNGTSDTVLSFASSLSITSDLDLELVHACHPQAVDLNGNTWDGIVRSKVVELNKLVNGIEENRRIGRLTKKNVIEGLAGDVLTKYGSDNENALLIIGSNTKNKKLKTLLGSASRSVLKKTKNPIVILQDNAGQNKVENVAFAALDIEHDKKSFLKFKKYFKSDLEEIHFISYQNPSYQEEELRKFILSIYPKIKFNFHYISGDNLVSAINEFCSTNKIDLLVATKTKKGFIQKLFETSVTKQLATDSITSLLIVQ